MLSQAGPADDIDATDFFVLSDGELTGMDLACHFTDAEPKSGGNGKAWVVKASCESGSPAVPDVFTIGDAVEGSSTSLWSRRAKPMTSASRPLAKV